MTRSKLGAHGKSGRWVVKILLFALLSVGSSTAARGQTYYLGPDGSDANSGQSVNQPFGSFEKAVGQLRAGDTLKVLDGVYEQDGRANRLHVSGKRGTKKRPIVIQAQHERRAWLKGDGDLPAIDVIESAWVVVDGFRVSSADNPDFRDGNAARVVRSEHITLRRLLAHHSNRYDNTSLIGGQDDNYVLIEECEGYFFHRHGISFYKSDHITIQRSFVNGRHASDLDDEDAATSHGCCREAGDEGFSFYFSSEGIVENSISMHSEALGITAGVATDQGNPGGQNVKMLGSISYKDLRIGPGGLQSRKFKDPKRTYTGPAKNILYKDNLAVGGQQIDEGAPFSPTVAQDLTIDGATWYNTNQTIINADPDTRDLSDRFFLGCNRDEVGGCDYDVRNVLLLDNSAETLIEAPDRNQLDFLMEYSNSWREVFGDEDITDDEGRFQHSTLKKPTGIGLDDGECIVFVPKESNMSGAGKNGADIGANILYRYEDGELTDEPLWNPKTGAFPHGAVIEGSPNDPDEHEVTASNIHERLNVNTNGCRLPYSKVAVDDAKKNLETTLKANYPNPFRDATTITYELQQTQKVTLTVYDLLGRKVATLVDGAQGAGEHRVRFDGRGQASGVYVYRLTAGGEPVGAGKMLLAQ